MRRASIRHQFVDTVPDQLDEGVLYVALKYRTVLHKCLCGCGHEVATPLGPTDWRLTYDGVSVSLYPSVGNWSLACRSHYWIDRDVVRWAGQWSEEQIAAGRAYDRQLKITHYGQVPFGVPLRQPPSVAALRPFWERWMNKVFGWCGVGTRGRYRGLI